MKPLSCAAIDSNEVPVGTLSEDKANLADLEAKFSVTNKPIAMIMSHLDEAA